MVLKLTESMFLLCISLHRTWLCGPGPLLGPLWPVLGCSWCLCRRSWAALGTYVGGLGPLLALSRRSWAALGTYVGDLGPLLGLYGRSWANLGPSTGGLGCTWAALGAYVGDLEPLLRPMLAVSGKVAQTRAGTWSQEAEAPGGNVSTYTFFL